MKKIIFILFVLFINIISVKASDETFWSDTLIENNSLIELINTERRYEWYRESILYSDKYYIEGYSMPPFTDKIEEDYIETDFTDWVEDNYPLELPNRLIETRVVNKYREIRPVKYIFFTDIMGNFNLSEIRVLINDIPIDYDALCSNCSLNFSSLIKNNNMTDSLYISSLGDLRIDLKKFYHIKKIKIELYTKDTNYKQCNISIKENGLIDDQSFLSSTFTNSNLYTTTNNILKYVIYPDNNWTITPLYNNWIYTDTFLNATYYLQMATSVETRYKDIKYRYSVLDREYMEGFYASLPEEGYIRDEETYVDYYQYRYIDIPVIEETNIPLEKDKDIIIKKENPISKDIITSSIDLTDPIVLPEKTIEKGKREPTSHVNKKSNLCKVYFWLLIIIVVALIIKKALFIIRNKPNLD